METSVTFDVFASMALYSYREAPETGPVRVELTSLPIGHQTALPLSYGPTEGKSVWTPERAGQSRTDFLGAVGHHRSTAELRPVRSDGYSNMGIVDCQGPSWRRHPVAR